MKAGEEFKMNYKQTEIFNEKKIMFLITMASYNLHGDEEGVHLPKIQLKKYFGIKGGTYYRILKSLEADNLIKLSYSGYETGKKSQRWQIQKSAVSIINNINYLIKYNNILNNKLNKEMIINNKRINEYKYNAPMLPPSITTQCYRLHLYAYSFAIPAKFCHFSITMLPLIEPLTPLNLWYRDNESLHYHLLDIINDIYDLVIENNKYTNLKNVSSLRYETNNEKVKISGRVCNYLCNTKSNKHGKIYKNTNFRPDRKTVLGIYGYENYKEIFDIKSQIPRLTYILQGGNYSDIEDFYHIENKNIDRKYVKKWFMNVYFDTSLKAGAWHATRTWHFENVPNHKFTEKSKKLFSELYEIVYNHFHNLIKPIGTEIFLWSAYWEQLIIKTAREQLGINLLNVYDGFYFENDNFTEKIKNIVIETSETIKTIYKKRLEIEFQKGI